MAGGEVGLVDGAVLGTVAGVGIGAIGEGDDGIGEGIGAVGVVGCGDGAGLFGVVAGVIVGCGDGDDGLGCGVTVGGDCGRVNGTTPGGNGLGAGGDVGCVGCGDGEDGCGEGFTGEGLAGLVDGFFTGEGVSFGVGFLGVGLLNGTISGCPGISIFLCGIVVGLVGASTTAAPLARAVVPPVRLVPKSVLLILEFEFGFARFNGTALFLACGLLRACGDGGSRRGNGGLRIGGVFFGATVRGVLGLGGGLFGKTLNGLAGGLNLGPP